MSMTMWGVWGGGPRQTGSYIWSREAEVPGDLYSTGQAPAPHADALRFAGLLQRRARGHGRLTKEQKMCCSSGSF